MNTRFFIRFIPVVLFVLQVNLCTAQTGTEKECKTTVELDVLIDTIYDKPDTAEKTAEKPSGLITDKAAYCNPCYRLQPANDKYRVVEFGLDAEDEEGYINSVTVQGDRITSSGRSLLVLNAAKKNAPVSFYCIKARHENGSIYVLKSFNITKR